MQSLFSSVLLFILRKLFSNQTFLQANLEGGNHMAKTTMMLRKLFCKHTLFASNQRAQETHLASLACVVSCWRLVAFLCRFARNLSARASYVSLLRVAAAL